MRNITPCTTEGKWSVILFPTDKGEMGTFVKQEVSLKKIIFEGYRAVGGLHDSFLSSNLLLLFFNDFGRW